MQVKNNTEAPIMLNVRTNIGATVTYTDPHGNEVSKPEHPQTLLIAIPAEATVEIDDEVWTKALVGKTTVKELVEVKEIIPGAIIDKKPVYRSVMEPTGRTMEVNLIKERIKKGDLTIVEKVKTKITLAEMIKALAGKKIAISKETHTEEEILTLYETVCA